MRESVALGGGSEQNEVEGLAEVLKERKSHRKKASFFHSPALPTSPSQSQTISTPILLISALEILPPPSPFTFSSLSLRSKVWILGVFFICYLADREANGAQQDLARGSHKLVAFLWLWYVSEAGHTLVCLTEYLMGGFGKGVSMPINIWDPTTQWNIDSSWICFPRGSEDDLIKVETCRPDNTLFLLYIK